MLAAGGTIAVGGLAVHSFPVWSTVAKANAYKDFLRLSALLVPHVLDELTGKRLAIAFKADQPPMKLHVAAMLALAAARRATKVEDFYPFATGSSKAAALRIISAWYLGVVEDVPTAQVFADQAALMYKPTSDVMTIPTYAVAGPSEWNAVSAPLNPMPKF